MKDFGVLKPYLKAIAKTSEMPTNTIITTAQQTEVKQTHS